MLIEIRSRLERSVEIIVMTQVLLVSLLVAVLLLVICDGRCKVRKIVHHLVQVFWGHSLQVSPFVGVLLRTRQCLSFNRSLIVHVDPRLVCVVRMSYVRRLCRPTYYQRVLISAVFSVYFEFH